MGTHDSGTQYKEQFTHQELFTLVGDYRRAKSELLYFPRLHRDDKPIRVLDDFTSQSRDKTTTDLLNLFFTKNPPSKQSSLMKETWTTLVKQIFSIQPENKLEKSDFLSVADSLHSLHRQNPLTDDVLKIFYNLINKHIACLTDNSEPANETHALIRDDFFQRLYKLLKRLIKENLLTPHYIETISALNADQQYYFFQALINHADSIDSHADIEFKQATRDHLSFDAKEQLTRFFTEALFAIKDMPDDALPLLIHNVSAKSDPTIRATFHFSLDNVTSTSLAYCKLVKTLNANNALTDNNNEKLNALKKHADLFRQLAHAWPHCFHYSGTASEHFWEMFNLLKIFNDQAYLSNQVAATPAEAINLQKTLPKMVSLAIMLYQADLLNENNLRDCIRYNQKSKNRLHNIVVILSESGLLTQANFNLLFVDEARLLGNRTYRYFWKKIAKNGAFDQLDQNFLTSVSQYDNNQRFDAFKRLVSSHLKSAHRNFTMTPKPNKSPYKKHAIQPPSSAQYTQKDYRILRGIAAWGLTPVARLAQGIGLLLSTAVGSVASTLKHLVAGDLQRSIPVIGHVYDVAIGFFSTPHQIYRFLKMHSEDYHVEPVPTKINKQINPHNRWAAKKPLEKLPLSPSNDALIKTYLYQQYLKQKRYFSRVMPTFLHRLAPSPVKQKPEQGELAENERFYGTKREIKSSYKELLMQFNSPDFEKRKTACEALQTLVSAKTARKTEKFNALSTKLSEGLLTSATPPNDTRSNTLTTYKTHLITVHKSLRKQYSALFKECERQHHKLAQLESITAALKRPGLSK